LSLNAQTEGEKKMSTAVSLYFPARFLAVALILAITGTCVFAATPANTGQFRSADDKRDLAYTVVGDTTGQISSSGADINVSAFVATQQPTDWGSLGDASAVRWIAPAADQSKSTRGSCCFETFTAYETQFNVTDPSQINLSVTILAKDYADVHLNGTVIYSGVGSQVSKPVVLTITSSKVKLGVNTIDFVVFDTTGGPTGLEVVFKDNNATPPSSSSYCDPTAPFCPRAPAQYSASALVDPVDSATGQFYAQTTDLNLGGPLAMKFARYYSSTLSGGGYKGSLGTNWMNSFEAGIRSSATTAEVLLFGGRVIKFTKVGSAWQLASPLDALYQLVAAGTTFQFLDPQTQLISTFSQAGALTRIQDRNGNAVTVTQGANGPTQAADNFGRTLTFTYANNLLSGVVDQAGRTVLFSYTNGLLTTATDPLGNATRYAYATAGSLTGLMTQQILPTAKTPTTQTYDASGRVTLQADPGGNTYKAVYDGAGGTKVTSPLGDVVTQASDLNGNLVGLADPSGASAKIVYDSNGRRTSVTDKLGGKITYSYLAQTNLLSSITDSLGNTTTYTYAAQPLTGFTFYNLTGVGYPDGTSTTIAYDTSGNMISLKRPDGNTTQFAYDSNGRVNKLTDAKGGVELLTYGADGMLATIQDPLGNKTAYTYDAARQLAKSTDPNGGITSFSVDARGQVTAITDPVAAATKTTYDSDGQMATWTAPAGGQFKYTYAPSGQIASTTDPLGNATAYS